MTGRLKAVLLAVTLLVAVGVVVGAKAVMGDHREAGPRATRPHIPDSQPPGATRSGTKSVDAMAEGYRLAAVVNYRSWQLHKKMWITPVHCAADTPHLFACSFQSTNPDVCRFVRFYDDHGNMEIRLAGLVPTTFCKGGKRVAVQ